MSEFFYDGQIRRFLIQFARILSEWQVTYGKDPQGNDILYRVPVQYGDASRQAATIIANNSASNLPHAPMITYYISGLEYDQKRTQSPYYVDRVNVRQRATNPDTGELETIQGNAFTVERLMPVPYTLRVNVDIWTTNYNQRLQLVEQLGTLFNPSLEIQSTDNFIDWTSLSQVYQDGLTFNSRTIPMGTGNPIDVTSWKFYMPIWISNPVKVKKLSVIHKVIATVHSGSAITDIQDDQLLLGTRQKITPYGYRVLWLGNTLQVLPAGTSPTPSNNDIVPNTSVLVQTGGVRTTTFTTFSNCQDIQVGQLVQFIGVDDTDEVPTVVSVESGDAGDPITITLSNTQTINNGYLVDFYDPANKNTEVYWQAVINAYGAINPGVSMITFEHPDLPTQIRGTIAYDPTDARLMLYEPDPDTLPQNTLDPLNGVINPQQKGPGFGLPAAVVGSRYLIVENIGANDNYLQLRITESAPAGSLNFKLQRNVLEQYSQDELVGKVIQSINQYNQQVFPDLTVISSIDYSTNTITLDQRSAYALPAEAELVTSLFIGARAWGENLVAQANDIIEYDINNVTTTTSGITNPGSYSVTVSSTIGIKPGYSMYCAGVLVAKVVTVNSTTHVVTLDRQLTTPISTSTTVVFSVSGWYVAWDSSTATATEFVTNNISGIQYRWSSGQWIKSYEGFYEAGDWNIVI